MERIQLRQVYLLDYPECSFFSLLLSSSLSANVENKQHVRQKDKRIEFLVSKYLRRFTLNFLGS